MSQSENALEYARRQLDKVAVLQAALYGIRSKNPDAVVFVFEGKDDVGVYDAWISRIDDSAKYYALPAKGKAQLLSFYARMSASGDPHAQKVYYFIDRDFDESRGVAIDDSVYMTPGYSIENFLVSERVLRSLLVDEFQCHHDEDQINSVVDAFHGLVDGYVAAIRDVNLRIFLARKRGIPIQIHEAILEYLQVSISSVQQCYDMAKLEGLVSADAPIVAPTGDELNAFKELDLVLGYRGKFLFAFFVKWLAKLVVDRRSAQQKLFKSTVGAVSFSPEAAELRYFASRSAIPADLREFVGRAFPQEALSA